MLIKSEKSRRKFMLNKLKLKLNNLMFHWNVKRAKSLYSTTIKGECQVQYIIDKYINLTKPDDYNITYEQPIERKTQQWKQEGAIKTYFYQMDIEDGVEEDEIKVIAALNYLCVMLTLMTPEQRNKYVNQVIDDNTKQMIKKVTEV